MMKTVKEVATLTGVSVRTLQYYDEIGVLKPTAITAAGYRLYDEAALGQLQQILFFKELDFPLKQIKEIMATPGYNQQAAFQKQKELLLMKRQRLNNLLKLLEKLEKGEVCMSFQEFDLSGYIQILEQFKAANPAEVTKHWGSPEAFNQLIEKVRTGQQQLGELAVKQYGSVEKYTAAMEQSLSHFAENMAKMQELKDSGYVEAYLEKNALLTQELLQNRNQDPSAGQVQKVVKKLAALWRETPATLNIDQGEHYYDLLIDQYLHNAAVIKAFDEKHSAGACQFMGQALQCYFCGEEKG